MFNSLSKYISITLIGLVSVVYADFYVIPIGQKAKNVVTVGKSNAKYRDIQSALDSITDAGPFNRYVVFVKAGEYNVTTAIHMKSYVDITGSGMLNTVIQGNLNSDSDKNNTIILGADYATLSHFSIKNEGGKYNNGATYLFSTAIYSDSGSLHLHDLNVVARGGRNCSALEVIDATVTAENCNFFALGCDYSTFGVRLKGSSGIFTNITVNASGPNNSCASIFTFNYSPLAIVKNSYLKADKDAISSGIIAFDTTIDGPTSINTSPPICYSCVNELGEALDENCTKP